MHFRTVIPFPSVERPHASLHRMALLSRTGPLNASKARRRPKALHHFIFRAASEWLEMAPDGSRWRVAQRSQVNASRQRAVVACGGLKTSGSAACFYSRVWTVWLGRPSSERGSMTDKSDRVGQCSARLSWTPTGRLHTPLHRPSAECERESAHPSNRSNPSWLAWLNLAPLWLLLVLALTCRRQPALAVLAYVPSRLHSFVPLVVALAPRPRACLPASRRAFLFASSTTTNTSLIPHHHHPSALAETRLVVLLPLRAHPPRALLFAASRPSRSILALSSTHRIKALASSC